MAQNESFTKSLIYYSIIPLVLIICIIGWMYYPEIKFGIKHYSQTPDRELQCKNNIDIALNTIRMYKNRKGKWPWRRSDSNAELFRRIYKELNMTIYPCPYSNLPKPNHYFKDSADQLFKLNKTVSYIYRNRPIPIDLKKSKVPIIADSKLRYHGNFIYVGFLDGHIERIYGDSVSEIVKQVPQLGNDTFVKDLER